MSESQILINKQRYEKRSKKEEFASLQGKCRNKVRVSVTQACIQFSNVSWSSVKWQIYSKWEFLISNNTSEVNNGVGSRTNASAYSSIFMLILEFNLKINLCPYEYKLFDN